MKSILFFLGFLFFTSNLNAESGYHIEVELTNFEEKQLFLAYHYGDKQYIKDTADVNEDGYFVFAGQEALDPGVYLLVMPPNNQHFQILINDKEQNFSIKTNAKDPSTAIKITGSKDNELFYSYLNFLATQRPIADGLRQEIETAKDLKSKTKLEESYPSRKRS